MKVKALRSFYVNHLRRVAVAGDQFETSDSHARELIDAKLAEEALEEKKTATKTAKKDEK